MGAPDYTDRYNTPLSDGEEQAYSAWVKRTGRERDAYDYDLRGAWKADVKQAANGHLPDTYKKPNHPTFSDQSMYNGLDNAQGGQWVDAGNGQWQFVASPHNVSNIGAQGLSEYFKQREPDVSLILPQEGIDPMRQLDRLFAKGRR